MLNQSDATVSPTAGKRAAVPLPFWRYANRSLAKFTLPQTDTYSDDVCLSMKRFYDSLDENDRRRYAAIEAEKLVSRHCPGHA